MTARQYLIELTPIADKREELWPLLVEHYEELNTHPDLMKLEPDVSKYEALEKLGCLFALVAKSNDEIVGYSITFVANHMHYKSMFYAHNDVLFVAKAHRHSTIGMRLISATEYYAKSMGAKLMLWHAKEDTALAKLLPRKGYGVQDIIYSKEL